MSNETFAERKARRKEHYQRYVHGWKQVPCGACNGTGYYDHDGSPPCGCCDGTGKDRVPPAKPAQKPNQRQQWLAVRAEIEGRE